MAVWAMGRGEVEPVERRGCRVVHGRDLVTELGERPSVLTGDEVERIHRVMETYARGLDANRAQRAPAAALTV